MTLLLASLPAGPAEQIAATSYGPAGIHWNPLVPNRGFVLTVSGDWGEVTIRRTFKSGERPGFQPYDLPDGRYKWELRVIAPEITGDDGTNGRDPQLVRRLSRSRSGDSLRRRTRPPMPLSGSFVIQFGSILDPTRAQPETVR